MIESGLRPGVLEARAFLRNTLQVQAWASKRDAYNGALRLVDAKKKKAGELVRLDDELAAIAKLAHTRTSGSGKASSAKDHHLIHLEHSELMSIYLWKDTRGKARPNFKLVSSNREDSVRAVTSKAFLLASQAEISNPKDRFWTQSMDELTNLNGVGEATASCILNVLYPDKFPFMADEVIETIVPEKKRDYTRATYKTMRERLIEKCAVLNDLARKSKSSSSSSSQGGGGEIKEFTVSDVCTCLWVVAVESSLGAPKSTTDAKSSSSSSSGSSTGGGESKDSSETTRSGSKRKRA